MKLVLVGYGKMGQMVEKAARARGHAIAGITDRGGITQERVGNADVCVEFTHPDAVIANIKQLASLGKSMVIGTTGWYDRLDEVCAIVESAGVGAVYGPNFSVGVNLFYAIVAEAAKLLNNCPQYDVAGMESHHHAKADRPSGTARHLAEILQQHLPRLEELEFSSIRCGSIPGEHTVLFDSPVDSITLTHTARSRAGFAEGAVLAAEWVANKKGLYRFEEVLREGS